MNGFLNLLKPPGMTSAAVVGNVRRLTGEKRVGHAGTLDPEAAGVLPVMVGRAARLFDYLTEKEKTYVAECAFGCETDTQDAQGRVTVTGAAYPSREAVERAARQLTGDILQRPSAYSAVKRDGRALYELARAGKAVEAEPRPVHIGRIGVGPETANHGVMLTVTCGRGTYIRALCEDLGRLCGCPAHMRFLLRTQTGVFSLDGAMTLEEAAAFEAEGTLAGHLLPMDFPLRHLPRVEVPERYWKPAFNGVTLPAELFGAEEGEADALTRVYAGGLFLGLARRKEAQLEWQVILADHSDLDALLRENADDKRKEKEGRNE